ncbi:MAG: hypothetical protein OXN93_03040 [bacterium]|nr:hypothetical protein [bacterium]
MRFLLGVCLAGVLLACGTVGSVDGPVVEGNVTGGGNDALVSGTVIIEGDCIYLHDPRIDSRYPVVWPHRTSWNPAESAIKLPDGTLVHHGDEVSGGGGYHTQNLDTYIVPEGMARALNCVDNKHGEIAVFNSDTDIETTQP